MRPRSPRTSRHAFAILFALALWTSPLQGQLPERTKFLGDSAVDLFGWSVSGAGDVNGDGFADVIIGAKNDDNNGTNSGNARVFSGVDGAMLYSFDGAVSNFAGQSVGAAGDVDNDGFDDVIVGAPNAFNAGSGSGRAWIYSGLNGSPIHIFDGDSGGDALGVAVSGAGDVNGDGFDDVIVGAPGNDMAFNNAGQAKVFSGLDGSVIHTFLGLSPLGSFGASVSGAGDINGDGFDDVIVGAIDSVTGSQAGSARVYSGFDGTILFSFFGPNVSARLGTSVAAAGDVNNDGTPDIIVGAPGFSTNGLDAGRFIVFSGLNGSILITAEGDSASDFLGRSVSGAGDVNGDGFDDVVVGAFGDDDNGASSGSARVYSGADGSLLRNFVGGAADIQLGFSVSGAGDVDGDGLDDMIVGANADDINGTNSGSATIFSLCGQRSYGVGLDAVQTLNCRWASANDPANLTRGTVSISGASPFSAGIFAFSNSSTMTPLLNFTLLVDTDPLNALILNFGFDATGQSQTTLDMRVPALDGLTFFGQAVEINGTAPMGVFSSNGIELAFCR